MKIRTGFVSNSSSTSFVLLGFQFNGEQDEEELSSVAGFDVSIYYGSEDGLRRGVCVVGHTLAYGLDEYSTAEEIDIVAEIEKVEKLRNILGAETPIRLWAGEKQT